jgi:hypothetical protein
MVLTKQDLIGCLQNEVRILVHLAGKVKPEMLDYRPTPKQRSVIELLRSLTIMGPILVPSIKAGKFLVDEWTAAKKNAATLDFDATVKALEAESAFYVDAINGFSDEELSAEVNLFGQPATRGRLLVDLIVSGHAAYRTQLFCYLKSCGRDELSTMNLWVGVDGAV